MVIRQIKRLANIRYLPLSIAILAVTIVHFRWFFPFGILSSSDWVWQYAGSVVGQFSTLHAWDIGGLGSPNLNGSFYIGLFIAGLVAKLGLSFSLTERILYLIPITYLSVISAYYLVLFIVKNRWAASIGALVYSLNTYFLLVQTQHLTIAGAYAAAPLVVLSFERMLSSVTLKWSTIFVTSSVVMQMYDFRIYYIIIIVLGLRTIYDITASRPSLKIKATKIAKLAPAFIVIILLDMYWVIGTIKAGVLTDNSLFNRGLFGNNILNLESSLALFHPFWNGTKPIWFQNNNVPLLFWLVPAVAFCGLALGLKNRKVLFYGVIGLLGILLVKQVDAPFPGLYGWLHSHFPGFNAFREASKFYVLSSLSFSILVGAFFTYLKDFNANYRFKRLAYYSCISGLAVIGILLAKPYVSGEIGTLFKTRTIPADYKYFQQLVHDSNFARSMWLPKISRWTYYDDSKRAVSATDAVSNEFAFLNSDLSSSYPIQIKSVFEKKAFELVARNAGIEYFAVPIRDKANEDDFIESYGDDREYYNEILNNIPWLKKITNNQGIDIYKNALVDPYVKTFSDLVGFDTLEDIDSKLDLVSQYQVNNENFTLTGDLNAPILKVYDIFHNPTLTGYKKNSRITSITIIPNKSIYQSESAYEVYANNNGNQLDVTKKTNGIVSGGIQPTTNTKSIASYKFSNAQKLYVLSNGSVRDVSGAGSYKIGNGTEELSLFSSNNSDQIESGLASTNVPLNCNGGTTYASNTAKKAADGQSVIYSVKQGTACGTKVFSTRNMQNVKISFPYQLLKGKEFGYEVELGGEKVINKRLKPEGTNENFIEEILRVPDGVSSGKITVKAYPNDQIPTQGVVSVGTIRSTGVDLVAALNKPTQSFIEQKITSGSKDVSFEGVDYVYKNEIQNSSFENGLWDARVGDCNNYDDKPDIGMELLNDHSQDHGKYLELYAKNHVACTSSNTMLVDNKKSYRLTFDYRGVNASQAGYSIDFNDLSKTSISERINISSKEWSSFNKVLDVPAGATSAKITIYSYADDRSSQKVINQYDNFVFTAYPYLGAKYFQIDDTGFKNSTAPKISVLNRKPSSTTFRVTAAKGGFYVGLSEAFNQKWSLAFKNTKNTGLINGIMPFISADSISENSHFELNGYSNGWYIDTNSLCSASRKCIANADGTYDMELVAEFTPQRWFNLGMLISGVTLATCLGFLGYIGYRRIRKRSHA